MKMLENLGRKLILALAVPGLLATQAQAQYVYTTIDDPVAKAAGGGTYVTSISGNVVAGYYFGSLLHGFYHTLGTTNYTTIDDPVGYTNGSSQTQAFGISGNNIAGTYQDPISGGYYGFNYNMATSNYTTLAVPATITGSTQGYGIDGGNVVGLCHMSETSIPFNGYLEGFLATPSGGGYTYSTFYYPSPSSVVNEGSYNTTNYRTYVHGISGTNIVGYWVDENLVLHGFIYNINTASYTAVTSPSGGGCPLYGISSNTVVGYYADPNHSFNDSGFTYNIATSNYTTLRDPLAPQNTFAQGISGATVVGYYLDNNGVTHGFAASIPIPVLSVKEAGTKLVFTATNGAPGASGFILDTTDPTLPLKQWPKLSSNVFNTNGIFIFTNAIASNMPPTFYELRETP